MATLLTPPPLRTIADLLDRLGGVAPSRIRYDRIPGHSTEADVLDLYHTEGKLYELVDGVLVEKAMGFLESVLALALGGFLRAFVVPRNLGLVSGADGMVRLFGGLIRIPDVAFVAWERIPGGRIPEEPIPALAPDLAVEVLSEGNTPAEMAIKRAEYFDSGVRLVWLVDRKTRTVAVFTTPGESRLLEESDTLDGGDVLPGFALPLRDLFAELDRHAGA